MFIRTTSEKIVLALLVAFLLVTIAKDWFDFYSCGGAVGQCISDAGMMQLYTKSCMSLLMTVLAFMVAKRGISDRVSFFLRAAFILFCPNRTERLYYLVTCSCYM